MSQPEADSSEKTGTKAGIADSQAYADSANLNESGETTYKHHLKLILLVLFVDLLGFSLVVPLLPRYADISGFTATQIGLLMSAYPFCQLFSAPILGRLSDRVGRKPVLIASQMGTTISFIILAITQRFELMLFARMLDGASGGNILVAQAYIADVTPPKDRARSFGLIGMAFGFGFILGPTLGGILTGIDLGENAVRLPFIAAAIFSACAWMIVWKNLPESRNADQKSVSEARVIGRTGVRAVIGDPRIRLLVLSSAFLVLGWSSLEATISLFLKRRMGYSPTQASMAFAFLGLVGALGQGLLIRRMVSRYGEKKLVVWGISMLIAGFLMLSQVKWSVALFPVLVVAGLGQGMATPSLTGLISRTCDPQIQGAVFGTLSSAQTFSRMTNYYFSNQLMGYFDESAPFLSGAMILSVGLMIAIRAIRILNSYEVS
ncbi:MAG: hypothetical protein RJA81_2177 [Planctomycetota bacterium]|jgi:DHA1 family tetracycline resistance protein-like MFS transporter